MKIYFSCLPCFLEQALRACSFMDLDQEKTRQVVNEVAKLIPKIPMENSPPETGRQVYRIIKEISENPDPYSSILYFLLKAKCRVIARDLNISQGQMIFARNPGNAYK